MTTFTVVWALHSEYEGHQVVECYTVAEAIEITEQLLERDDDFVANGHLCNLIIESVVDHSICRCAGCNYARETGYDSECHEMLKREEEERYLEDMMGLTDEIETRGASRFGNNWWYDQAYVARANGWKDEIPF